MSLATSKENFTSFTHPDDWTGHSEFVKELCQVSEKNYSYILCNCLKLNNKLYKYQINFQTTLLVVENVIC